jgi:hypothetical protein
LGGSGKVQIVVIRVYFMLQDFVMYEVAVLM